MTPIPLGRIALETFGWFATFLASWASVRALATLIGWAIPGGFYRPKWLTRVHPSEVWCTLFVIALLAVGVKFYKLTHEERIYSGSEVEARLGPPAVDRRAPQGQPAIRGIPYADQPEWIADHVYWLEKEGDRDKTQGKIASYVIAEVEYVQSAPTKAFELVVRAAKDHAVWSHAAFRLTGPAPTMFQRLVVKAEGPEFRDLRVAVPECEANDRVVLLLRVASKARQVADDLNEAIQTRVE